jgi:putative transport protein
MIQLLLTYPLLLLFLVAAIGYALGRITVAGTSLGVAAVLFVGLAFGALHPDLKLPELVYQLGLVVFVYTIGISSGRQFWASLRRQGLRDNFLVLALLVVATMLIAAIGQLLGWTPGVTAGVFTGSLTNTAALAGALEYLQATVPPDVREQVLAEPVVGFSITYPVGVLGMIAVILLLRRVWHIDWERDAAESRLPGATKQRLHTTTIEVTHPDVHGSTVQHVVDGRGWDVTFGRIRHDGHLTLVDGHTRLHVGDLVSVVGPHKDVSAVAQVLGEVSGEHLEADRREFDFRRVFVSQPTLAGRRLRDLDLPQRFGAFVTRVRRGDQDFVAHGNTVLELGDRVRVVARPDQMNAVSRFFGDSYRALSEVDLLTLNLGFALGLLVGMIPIPLPGATIRLGFAGGPLIVALILGALGRTGPLVWSLPYSANLTLRQIGLILFLAGIGTRSGYAFVSTLQGGGGLTLFVAGAAITILMALVTLVLGYRVLHIPMGVLIGMLAGLQTQPALLGFALEQTDNDLPNIGYSAVYPIALITKIVCAQLLLALLP